VYFEDDTLFSTIHVYVCACVAMSVYSEHDTVHLCMCMCTHMQICVRKKYRSLLQKIVSLVWVCIQNTILFTYVCVHLRMCMCTHMQICVSTVFQIHTHRVCIQNTVLFTYVCVCVHTCKYVWVCGRFFKIFCLDFFHSYECVFGRRYCSPMYVYVYTHANMCECVCGRFF